MANLTQRAIRRGIYIVVSLSGIAYEFFYAESIRWPLIGGYLLVVAVAVYVSMQQSQQPGGDKNQTAD